MTTMYAEPWVGPDGFTYVTIWNNNGKLQDKRVDTLVAETFIGPCPPGKTLVHKDGDKGNNNLENLMYK